MTEPWVVTYKIETPCDVMIAEFYRGDCEECQRIEANSTIGEDDRRMTHQPWRVCATPASFWDAFLQNAVASGEFVVVGDSPQMHVKK